MRGRSIDKKAGCADIHNGPERLLHIEAGLDLCGPCSSKIPLAMRGRSIDQFKF